MEIIEAHSAWLSNFEVLKHLRLQKDERDQISVNIGRPVRTAENVQTLEFEALEYLEKAMQATCNMTSDGMELLLSYLKDLDLTKVERLQVVNLLPETEVEFYLIVEECEERFTPEQVGLILSEIRKIKTVSPKGESSL